MRMTKIKYMLRRFKKYRFILETEFIPILSVGIGYSNGCVGIILPFFVISFGFINEEDDDLPF